jgi:hypothetical protein
VQDPADGSRKVASILRPAIDGVRPLSLEDLASDDVVAGS